MKTYRVLVTGSAGSIGRAVCAELLARGHFVRGFDIHPTPAVPEHHVGTVSDLPTVDRALDSMDSIVHLAATPDEADFMTQLLPNNIVGVYNMLDSARRHKVRRIALASTLQTVSGLQPREDGLMHIEDGNACYNHYAVTKVFAETLGSMYARRYQLSVVAVRIGWLPRHAAAAQEQSEHARGKVNYLSHRDAGRFFACAIEAEAVSYALVFAVSRRSVKEGMDLEPARKLIGYEPMDLFPEGLSFEFPIKNPGSA